MVVCGLCIRIVKCSRNVFLKGDAFAIYRYRRIYLETLELCKNNPDILEVFYQESAELYEEINSIVQKQKGLFGRKLPIVSKVKMK